jgi:hypothetical protein
MAAADGAADEVEDPEAVVANEPQPQDADGPRDIGWGRDRPAFRDLPIGSVRAAYGAAPVTGVMEYQRTRQPRQPDGYVDHGFSWCESRDAADGFVASLQALGYSTEFHISSNPWAFAAGRIDVRGEDIGVRPQLACAHSAHEAAPAGSMPRVIFGDHPGFYVADGDHPGLYDAAPQGGDIPVPDGLPVAELGDERVPPDRIDAPICLASRTMGRCNDALCPQEHHPVQPSHAQAVPGDESDDEGVPPDEEKPPAEEKPPGRDASESKE